MTKEIPPFKIRASAAGKIMTDPKGCTPTEELALAKTELKDLKDAYDLVPADKRKLVSNVKKLAKITQLEYTDIPLLEQNVKNWNGVHLSVGAMTYARIWRKEQIYQRRQEFRSKQCKKGNMKEADAILMLNEHYKWNGIYSEQQSFSNDYATGHCDILLPQSVDDAKCSWSCFSFPLDDTEIENKDYDWQLDVYMIGFNRREANLHYCLMDAPDDMINAEYWRKAREYGESETDVNEKLFAEVEASMKYEHLPIELRLKTFHKKFNPDAPLKLENRVETINKYIYSLSKN